MHVSFECTFIVAECLSVPNASMSSVCELPPAGVVCEINLDECESEPCQNGGHCEDAINDYTCHCPPPAPDQLPWGGHDCDVPLTGCVPDPCQNNATCVPSLLRDQHQHTCTCPSGSTVTPAKHPPPSPSRQEVIWSSRSRISTEPAGRWDHKGPASSWGSGRPCQI